MTSRLPELKLDVRSVLSTTPPVADDVLPGLPTGAVGGLVAPGGVGKTMLGLGIGMALATGRGCPLANSTSPSAPREPAPVVLVMAEESVDEMHRRLHHLVAAELRHRKGPSAAREREELGALLETNLRLYPLAGRARLQFDGEGEMEALKALNELARGARLVVLDPLRQLHTGDENDSWLMTSLVQKFQSVASRHRCAVLLTHHTSKAASMGGLGDQAGASRGSGALTDALRWQMNLSRMDAELGKRYAIPSTELGHYVRVDLAKANYAPPSAPVVLRREAGGALKPLQPVLNALRGRGR